MRGLSGRIQHPTRMNVSLGARRNSCDIHDSYTDRARGQGCSRCRAAWIPGNCKTKEQWIEFFRKEGFGTFLRLNLFTIYDTPGVSCFLVL